MATRAPTTFAVDDGADVGAMADAVGASVSTPERTHRRWYDTFDWDLWDAGLVLEVDERGDGRCRAVLRDRHDHLPRFTQVVDAVPTVAEDLPAGPWRRALGSLLGLRALVPVAEADVATTELQVTDRRDKCVAMASVETVAAPGGSTTWVRIVPVRGYDDAARDLAAAVASWPGVTPSEGHPLAGATLEGRTPGISGTEVDLHLEADEPAVHAVAAMLRRFQWVMSTLEPWLQGAPDTEFLHDWRVALRRSRSVLKLARDIVPARDLDLWRPRLRDLQQRSGELRDLDVFVLEFDTYLGLVPEEYVEDLDPLRALLDRRRAQALREFEAHIASAEHHRLRNEQATFVDRLAHIPPAEHVAAGARDADRPIGDVGVERIRRAHRRVVKRGRRIDDDSPAADLHEVRIATKEFRYAIELHASLLDPDATKQLLKRLKSLQDLLGGFQDAEAHAAAMGAFAEDLVAGHDAPARSVMTIGLLAQAFTDRNADVRDRFHEEFGRFDDRATRDLLDRSLGGRS